MMIQRIEITKEQALSAVPKGEFSKDIITSNDIVIILMTQDWCPQWTQLEKWIYDYYTTLNIDAYELIYNGKDFFTEFMTFKENIFRNRMVPYLRFYRNGVLRKETNYISKGQFEDIINAL